MNTQTCANRKAKGEVVGLSGPPPNAKERGKRIKVKPIKTTIVAELQQKHLKGKQAATAAATTET